MRQKSDIEFESVQSTTGMELNLFEKKYRTFTILYRDGLFILLLKNILKKNSGSLNMLLII